MKEYINNQSDNLIESSNSSLYEKAKLLLRNTKKAVRDTLTKVGIATSLVGGTMATEATTASLIPETAAVITNMATNTGVAVKTITLGTAAAIAAACDRPDVTPPTVQVINSNFEISGGETLRINGNQVYVGNTLVFRCSDDVSTNLNIVVTFNGKTISSGDVINEGGTISARATDEAGNPSKAVSATIKKKEVINKPEITVLKSQVDISKGGKTSVSGKGFFIGNEKVISWTEDNCTPSIIFDGKSFTIGDDIEKEGLLVFTLTNNKGLSDSKNINIVDGNEAPEVTIYKSEGNIFGGVEVTIGNNQLTLGNLVVAKGTDDNTKDLDIKFEVDGKTINSGEILNVGSGTTQHAGKITFTDEKNKSTYKDIQLENNINKVISGLDKLNSLSMEVDKEVNLLDGISFKDAKLVKVEVEIDGKRYEIGDPNHYKPTNAGTCKVIFTVEGQFGNTGEVNSNVLTIKGIEYQGVSINNIKPVDILPIIGQVEVGDKECYSHIEHLRIAEATRIRDMMWKYGAGTHSPEQYQELMARLNTGMLGENPIGYTNNDYEIVGGKLIENPSDHAHDERFTLNTFIKHANFIIVNTDRHRRDLYNFCKSNPNKINIMGYSRGADARNREQYDGWPTKEYQEYDKEKNRLVFCAGGNIRQNNGSLSNKIYQENYPLPDTHSVYGPRSRAHNKDDNTLDRHLLITFGTNGQGNVNITNQTSSNFSKFPVGFHDKVLFAGRTFPYSASYNKGKIEAERSDGYATSHTNYVNVAIMDLCFQMFAEVKDVDELLEMVRSTCDTDYIRLDGQTQELQLMNPAKFFKKYLMPKDIPSNISAGQTISLEKGYYKGVVFAIPGAEVKINGQWVEYSKANESLIKSQNPMLLEWRLNGDLVTKYNKSGTVTGKTIAVDDQWNGLNLDVENIKVTIQNIAGVTAIGIGNNIILTNLLNQGPLYDIPPSIRPGETIMLTNLSNQRMVYDIPGAQIYIKGKSWVSYNDENKALIQSQDLKNSYWRLNGDLAQKTTRNGYVKGKIFTLNDNGDSIDKEDVTIHIEDYIQNNKHLEGYIAQGYVKNEGEYVKTEGSYTKKEGDYRKSEGG